MGGKEGWSGWEGRVEWVRRKGGVGEKEEWSE